MNSASDNVILYSCWEIWPSLAERGGPHQSSASIHRCSQGFESLTRLAWSANRDVGDEVWYRIVEDGDVERRLRESYDVELEDLKQRCEELRRRYPGPDPGASSRGNR